MFGSVHNAVIPGANIVNLALSTTPLYCEVGSVKAKNCSTFLWLCHNLLILFPRLEAVEDWRQYLALENIQTMATKFILKASSLDYRKRLNKLSMLPHMSFRTYMYRPYLCCMRLVWSSQSQAKFPSINLISFFASNTRSFISLRMVVNRVKNSLSCTSLKYQFSCQALVIDLDLQSLHIERNLKQVAIGHFRGDFFTIK